MVTKHIPNAVWNQMGLIFSEHSDRHSLGKHLLEVTRITNSSSGIDYPGISLWEQSIRQTPIFPIDVDKNKHMCYNPHRFRCIRQSHTENHYS